MKATVNTAELIKALKRINNLAPSRVTLPVLRYFKMDFHDGKLVIQNTDLQQALTVEVKATIDEPFTVVLPQRATVKFVTEFKGSTVIYKLNKKDNSPVVIEQEGVGAVTMQTVNPSEFVPIPKEEGTTLTWHTVDTKWFTQIVNALLLSCAPDESRPVLTGVCLSDGAMASADGFRLTVVKSDRLNFGLGKRQIIVPKETLALLVRIFTDKPTIAIGWAENKGFDNKVFFKSEGGSVTQVSQLIQGTFPQYEQLIPPSFNSRIAISAPLMAHRLNMIEASEGSGIVKLYTKEEGVLAISHRVEEMYDYEMTIPMKAVGTPIKIAFAYKYLVSALKCFSMCYMETTNPSSPIRITGDIEELTIICMPMFIQW